MTFYTGHPNDADLLLISAQTGKAELSEDYLGKLRGFISIKSLQHALLKGEQLIKSQAMILKNIMWVIKKGFHFKALFLFTYIYTYKNVPNV